MPQSTVKILPVLRRELPWFALMAVALGATFVVSHFVVHHGFLLPSIAAGSEAPLWVWAALYAPELVALLMVGWRLRSWALVGLYAGGAAALREASHLALCWTGHAPHGHAQFGSALTELAIALPITAAAYALVFLTASAAGRDASTSGGAL